MPPAAFTFTAVVEVQDGPAPWSFVALPAALARELPLQVPGGVTGRGWGSLRVQATHRRHDVGHVDLPLQAARLLPAALKAEVRAAEGLRTGSTARVGLRLDP